MDIFITLQEEIRIIVWYFLGLLALIQLDYEIDVEAEEAAVEAARLEEERIRNLPEVFIYWTELDWLIYFTGSIGFLMLLWWCLRVQKQYDNYIKNI